MIDYKEKFADRHIGPDQAQIKEMLDVIGYGSLDELTKATLPENILFKTEKEMAPALSEQEMLEYLKKIASKNKVYKSFIGMGYYNTITPPVILRNVLENPGWYTQYTPYQAEISQGRLEALLNFQTMILDLTGMELANSSLLDEGTAAGEAMTMFKALGKKKQGNKFFVDQSVFPQTKDILVTRAEPLEIELVYGDYKTAEMDESYFGALVQYPNNEGSIEDYASFCEKVHSAGAKLCAAADILALTLITPPGEWGADCVVGTTQRFGVPPGFGGPHAAYFATKDEFKRQVPGRIIGISKDRYGNNALRMALQTREQHIKRQNATSNICTAQVLLAIMAGMYATYHGPQGLIKIAKRIHDLTQLLESTLVKLGYSQLNESYFDTLLIEGKNTDAVKKAAEAKGINFRYFDNGNIGISLDETVSTETIEEIVGVFAEAQSTSMRVELAQPNGNKFPGLLVRTSRFLEHEVFHSCRSEHEMLRYLKSLENKDLSLTHSMISLGSCTMKLNATTEMIPVTWEAFNSIHPFVPANQALGYKQMIDELEADLSVITGFPGVSLQPNAGAQGEFTGLLVIRAYLKSIGQGHRNIAIIPSSAHGTNPASAVLAGMKVVVVACDDKGNIDVADLEAKVEEHKENLAALMITYPSTHGVFEPGVKVMTKLIHDNGGQVYMDGANMNAQVGLTSPAEIGADVCHLNLHKTFCIPHGGGGPGMGPICVGEHLKPFLPGHAVVDMAKEKSITAVSAAPWGSASILLISYTYIKMMGWDGLKKATQVAILNANYMKRRLEENYKTLYSGVNGNVAHELILDTREFKKSCGIEAEDIAKRLMDYGFHSPTLSFPVAGTLMIEPTESESKVEMDRFINALHGIYHEIKAVESGEMDPVDNVLKNAPHTCTEICGDEWSHNYLRSKAAYPTAFTLIRKFWPTVGRVDSTFGDRNLVCACLPLEAYMEA